MVQRRPRQSGRCPYFCHMTRELALEHLERYCDYQDRCHLDVHRKLVRMGIRGDDRDWIVGELLRSGHLNEERFARSLARGKFRINGWGRLRIAEALRIRKIGEYLCRKALEEIPEDEYEASARHLLESTLEALPPDLVTGEIRNRLRSRAIARGFEPALLDRLVPEVMQAGDRQQGDK